MCVEINGKKYDDPVTEIVKLGSIEIWRFINNTDDAHPMHLHLVQFQILQRQGFNPCRFETVPWNWWEYDACQRQTRPDGRIRRPSTHEKCLRS